LSESTRSFDRLTDPSAPPPQDDLVTDNEVKQPKSAAEKSAGIFSRKFTANIAARYVMVLSLAVRLSARTDPGRAQVVGGLVQIFAPLYPGTGDHRIVVRRQWLERLERLVPNKKD
jgi:hypothetical protein